MSDSNKKIIARDPGIDLLRGLVIILMALDHAKYFYAHFGFDPTDLQKTTPVIFAARWITHFCAPTFVFLAGLSGYLRAYKNPNRPNTLELRHYLWTRGLFLMLLELTVLHYAWEPELGYSWIAFNVIWILGLSMVAWAGLLTIPRISSEILGIAGLVLVATHHHLDGFQASDTLQGFLWSLFHEPKVFSLSNGFEFYVVYPWIPWVGVMLAGFGFGKVYKTLKAHQLALLGLFLTVLFMVLRGLNGYGDPKTWETQSDRLLTFLSFINCEKYPPSLDFLLMTLGPAICCLSFLKQARSKRWAPVELFGRVPLFFYIVHFFFLQYSSLLIKVLFHQPSGLMWTFSAWVACIVFLYPACAWYDRLKRSRKYIWTEYV